MRHSADAGRSCTQGETEEVSKKQALLQEEGVHFHGHTLAGKQYLASLEELHALPKAKGSGELPAASWL